MVENMKIISNESINLSDILNSTHNIKTGAIVLFSGDVRNHHNNKAVDYIEYEAHIPMAEKMIKEICDKAKQKWNLHNAICIHRIGKVNPGECSVCIVTGSSHRKEAYEANQFIINTLKEDVPIWKKEFFSDGTTNWK